MHKKENKNLYTSIFQYQYNVTIGEHCYGPLFIHQFYLKSPHELESVLKKWTTLVARKIMVSREEYKNITEGLESAYIKMGLEPIGLNFENIWKERFLLAGSLHIVKTVPWHNSVDFLTARTIRASYFFYKNEYDKFKRLSVTTKDIRKQCKQYERLMLSWREKQLMIMKNTTDTEAIYTLVMEYDEDYWMYQCTLADGEDINNILKYWSTTLPDNNNYFVRGSEEYDLLSRKIENISYELFPVENLVNVWSTWLSLCKGVCNIYVIKTEVELTPVG